MKVVSSSIKDYDELDVPDTIYKYRYWENDYHKTIVTRREVFFAKPSSFEDPFDCKNQVRYDLLTDKDIYDHYFLTSKERNPNWTRQQHREYARNWTKISPIKDKEYVKETQKKEFEDYDEQFGVLSLTADPLNYAMWNCYSNNLKGFAIGFNTKIMFRYLGGGGAVQYCDELPIIYPRPKHSFEVQTFLQNYTKLRKWEFEKEYRTQLFRPYKMSNKDRTITLPPEAFKEILLGPNIEKSIETDLMNCIPNELSGVKIIKTNLIDNKITIDN